MQLFYRTVSEWPALVWLAECSRGSETVLVLRGPDVEETKLFFCEAVWKGSFAEGDFDRTDIIMGSGGRIRNDQIVFVSSGSTLDRLQYVEHGDKVWISNSLACLSAYLKADLDPICDEYPKILGSIVRGLNGYTRGFTTTAGYVNLVYFRNLIWNGKQIVELEKNAAVHQFATEKQFLSDNSMKDYFAWLMLHRDAFHKAGIAPVGYLSQYFDRFQYEMLHALESSARFLSPRIQKVPILWRLGHKKSFQNLRTITFNGQLKGYRRFIYGWAFNRAKQYYPFP